MLGVLYLKKYFIVGQKEVVRNPKEQRLNNVDNIVLSFRSSLIDLIERNRRRSRATMRIS